MPDGLVVGVDVGSSSVRALAIDDKGEIVATGSAVYPGAIAWPHGRADPQAWLAGVGSALAALGTTAPDATRPAALAVGGQSPTTVPDAHGLAVTCIHPAGATESPEGQHAAQWELLRRELGGDVGAHQIWDWILQQLGAAAVAGRWPGDPELPGYGERVPTGQVVGTADGTAGIAAGTPLVTGAQDAYLSFWAGGLDEPGRAMDPGGRTGGLGVAVEAGRRPEGMYALAGPARGVDIVGGPTSSHGLALEWWSAMTGHTVAELIDLAADVPRGARGVLALPYFEGERAPRWNRELRAELRGLAPDTGSGDVARALLEATAYGLAHIAAELAASGVAFDLLVVGGSPARSALWSSIKASVLGVPVEVPASPELAAYGAALAAGAAVGWWPAPGEAGPGSWPRPRCEVIEPERHEEYVRGFARFVAAGDEAVSRIENERKRCT